jgi:hypothetical protein
MAGSNQLYKILSEYEGISPAELERIKTKHRELGGSLAELLVHESLIDEEDLFFLMSQQLGVPAIPEERLLHLTLSPEIRRRVPGSMAKEWILVPLDLDIRVGRLSVAMFDPTDLSILDRLQHRARVAEIRAYLARRSAILEVVETAYSGDEGIDDHEELEDLPWLGSRGGSEEVGPRRLDPSPMEPKVELDPDLQQELEAINESARDGCAARPQDELAQAPEHLPPEETELHRGHGDLDQLPKPVELRGHSLLQEEPTRRKKLTQEEAEELAEPLDSTELDGTDPELEVQPVDPRHDTARFQLKDIDRIENEYEGVPSIDEPEETDMEQEITQVVVRSEMIESEAAAISQEMPPLPEIYQMEEIDALLRELLPSVGVLVSMLHERIDPTGGSYREYGRFCRLVARELGMDELTISRVALSAHLFGLDKALRQEVGTDTSLDVAVVFGSQPTSPGGLGPILRNLGALALDLRHDDLGEEPLGLRLIRLVADFLELRSESDEGDGSDMETMAQLLRTGGGDPVVVDALVRAIEAAESPRLRVDGGDPKHDE